MTKTIEAVFDGSVLHPDEPLSLVANTRVRITVETLSQSTPSPPSFLRVARSLELEGPPDWSSEIEVYLDGEHGRVNG